MTGSTTPKLYDQSPENFLYKELERTTSWRKAADDGQPAPVAGQAMVRLFCRLAEIITSRINQIPENHFRAFLNEAGVDLQPPQPARTDITFFPAKDAPEIIRVSSGTQLCAKKTESRPEIIFETERDLNVTRTELVSCIVVDPILVSDRTTQATGDKDGSFAVFQGDEERERLLFFRDDVFFCFPDAETAKKAVITLKFSFSIPGKPDIDRWSIRWSCFDGSNWKELEAYKDGRGMVEDNTLGFSRDGTVEFRNMPLPVFDKENNAWLKCELYGGTERKHLPTISGITGKIETDIEPAKNRVTTATAAMFSAIHAGTAFIPLDPKGEFFPLGQRPERLDAFYLMVDGIYFKEQTKVEITVDMLGIPSGAMSEQLDSLEIEWAYSSDDGWTSIGKSKSNQAAGNRAVPGVVDETKAFAVSGDRLMISFQVPGTTPPAKKKIGNKEGCWLRARILTGGYGLDVASTIWKTPDVFAPLFKSISVTYSGFPGYSAEEQPLAKLRGCVDRCRCEYSFADGSQNCFSPFTSPCDTYAMCLGFSNPFPEGEWIQLLLDVDEARTPAGDLPALLWEYMDCTVGKWEHLPVSDLSSGMEHRGYLGFYGPKGQGSAVLFGKGAFWLRVRPHIEPPVAVAPAVITVDVGTDGTGSVILDASGSAAADDLNIAGYIWNLVPPIADAGQDRYLTTSGNEAQIVLDASRSSDGAGRTPSNVKYACRLLSSSHLGARAQVNIPADDQDATVVLDAGGSFTADGSPASRYIWEKKQDGREGLETNTAVSSGTPIAKAQMVILTRNNEAAVCLDASGSFSVNGDPICKYIWQKRLAEKMEKKQSPPIPRLNAVRCNTVQAVNAITLREETLGSSNGKPSQTFACTRKPILPDIRLYVREPDEPSAVELQALQLEYETSSGNAADLSAFPLTQPADNGTWVRWLPVDDFHFSENHSRHFKIDPISAGILFGDGTHGRIPPIGGDNIKAAFYRSHQGAAGNVSAGEITVLRNPVGLLAAIKQVTNPAAGAGGSDAETVEQVMERGPKTLKHRGKAITIEDFEWLARDASGEIASAWCLPTRDTSGKIREGWVTVVILPDNIEPRPFPRPALSRYVRRYLESRSLANLPAGRHICVRGPEYLEAWVKARVVPTLAEKFDETKLAVTKRLDEFFHPLTGGPDRNGWELGRDVYLSEVYAEIEEVDGVDHVAELLLAGSQQQQLLTLGIREPLSHTVPDGAMVCNFDERIRYILADPLVAEVPAPVLSTGPSPLSPLELQVRIYGFKTGDRINIIDAAGNIIVSGVTITGLSAGNNTITLDIPFKETGNLPPAESVALISTDERIRLPIADWSADVDANTLAHAESFEKGRDPVCIVSGGQRYSELQFLPVKSVATRNDRIVIPEGHMVCSGAHVIEMILEE